MGDNFTSVYKFLQSRNADEETTKKIIFVLNEEHRARSKQAGSASKKAETRAIMIAGFFKLFIGSVILLISWYFYSRGMERGYIFFLPVLGMAVGALAALIGLLRMVIAPFRRD